MRLRVNPYRVKIKGINLFDPAKISPRSSIANAAYKFAIMLKGRGVKFAPKKGPIRRPGATPAPSSSRPSAEPQSQTPTPSQPTHEEIPPIPEEVPEHATTAVGDGNFSISGNGALASTLKNALTNSESTDTLSSTQLNRKESDNTVPESVAKRVQFEDTQNNPSGAQFAAQATPTTEVQSASRLEPNPPPTPTTNASVQDVSSAQANTLKRKERAPLPSAPPAKRLSSALGASSPARVTPASPLGNSPSKFSQSAPQISITQSPQRVTFEQGETSRAAETNHRQRSQSPDDAAALQHRYPSPENMVRLADEVSTGPLSVDGSPSSRISAVGSGANGSSDVVTAASLNPDGTSGGVIEELVSGAENGTGNENANASARRRRIQTADDGGDARATVNMDVNRARRATGAKRARRQQHGTRRPRVRASTPEGASDEEIDPVNMKMSELTKDLKIGKRFSKFAEIKAMEEQKKQENIKAKMLRQNPELAPLMTANGQANAASSAAVAPVGNVEGNVASAPREASRAAESANSPEPRPGVVSGPRMRLLNGRMVLDEASLTIDRHANAELEREGMEEVEENDFSRKITQGTFMKREPSLSWDSAANQLFYIGLRQFGTDFGMIASMFPHRNRRQIKLKFNKEEKCNAAKINRILMNPKEPIDLDQFEKMSNKKLQSVAEIEAERAKFDAEQREEIEKFAEAAAEATRKKKESIKGSEAARRILSNMSDESDDGEGGVGAGGSNKENNGKGGKKKAPARKGRRGKNNNNDEGEVVGTIE